jgi:hypothetical protein
MHYHSPLRPRWAGQGAYGKVVREDGVALGALPSLYLDPLEDGTWEVMVQLQVSIAAFRQFTTRVSTAELHDLLFAWRSDPEEVLRNTFGYDFAVWSTPQAAPREKSTTTLEDLGL